MVDGQTRVYLLAEIDVPMLSFPDSYVPDIVVEHGPILFDEGVETVGGEDIAIWVEENRLHRVLETYGEDSCGPHRKRESMEGEKEMVRGRT